MVIYFYDLIYILPLCIAAIRLLRPVEDASFVAASVYITALSVCVLMVILRHIGRKSRIVILGVISAFVIGLAVAAKFELFDYTDVNWMSFAMSVLAGVSAFAAGRLIIRFGRYRYIPCILIIGVLAYLMKFNPTDDKLSVGLLFFLLIIMVTEIIQKWHRSDIAGGYSTDVVYLLPFIAVFMVAFMLIRIPSKPYDWHQFWNAVNAVKKGTVNASEYIEWKFSTNSTFADVGFSDSAKLRSGIISNPSRELTVEIKKNAPEVLYITGKVFDTFDGQQWYSKYDDNARDRMLATMELRCALKSHDSDNLTDYVAYKNVKFQYITAKTPYLFVTPNAVVDDNFMSNTKTHEEGYNIMFSGNNSFKIKYNLDYYDINSTSPGFIHFLNSPITIDKEKWGKIQSEYMLNKTPGYSFEDLDKYHKAIRQYYLENIEISEELKSYLANIIDKDMTDYEKAKSLEKMFNGFKYNSKPGDMTSDIKTAGDFLDYFILEKREGYCTYFATAFVLLARYEGIPARYVQGFQVPMKGRDNKAIYVMSDYAHAWPEIYFEGKGWIPFEPTPGFGYEQVWSEDAKIFTDYSKYYQNQNNSVTTEGIDSSELAETEEEKKTVNVAAIIISMSLVIGFLVIFALVSKTIASSKNRKLDKRGLVLQRTKQNFELLKAMGIKVNQGETLTEYSIRAGNMLESKCVDFIGNYEKIIYSDYMADDTMINIANRDYERLLVELKRRSRFMYYLYCFGKMFK